jgi:hypothetical protein
VSIGVVGNRATLKSWVDAGAFPRGIKIAGPHGRTLVWSVDEVVSVLAERVAERDASPQNEESTPATTERSLDSNDPLAAGRNHEQGLCIYRPPTT